MISTRPLRLGGIALAWLAATPQIAAAQEVVPGASSPGGQVADGAAPRRARGGRPIANDDAGLALTGDRAALYAPPTELDEKETAGHLAKLRPFQVGLAVGGSATFLKADKARAQGLAAGGGGLDVALGLDVYDIVSARVAVGFLFIGDRSGFNQTVQDDLTGRVYQASSSAHMGVVLLSGGLRTPVLRAWPSVPSKTWSGFYASAHVGKAFVWGGREITDCTDCHAEAFDLEGGAFVEPGVHWIYTLNGSGALSFDAAYRRYFAGSSLEQEVPLTLTYWLSSGR